VGHAATKRVPAPFIRWFSEISLTDVALVGAKNASLGELYRELQDAGVRVPNGFAVTAAVCGRLSWWALYLDAIHPALALVPIVPFLPHEPRGIESFEDAEDAPSTSPRHFEHSRFKSCCFCSGW
jgi:hypothetical protein